MATSRRKRARPSMKRRVAAVLGPPADRLLMVELLKEMHHIVLDTAAELGVSANDRRRAMTLAQKDATRLKPSQNLLQPNHGIAGLLGRWRRDKRFLRPDGTPRALSITGKGATLETLARQFVPNLPVSELADMICENAEVTRLKGNKIALVGSPVMITPKTPEITLASLILRFRRLAQTIVYDAAIPAHVKGTGRFERVVTGELSDKEFRAFSQSVRQQLQDLCDRVDAGIRQAKHPGKGRAKGTACGIGLYVFRDDGNIG
jgi:hypothetical protein